ncbi:MAG: hypothetical protein KGL52_09885 [Rhodospirillales bacterium]|nr:hypothetical protein [Rhodospirillales bacterium]
MPDYLADAAARVRATRPVTGLATDGATFIAYGLRDGALHELARYATDPDRPDELLAWLELLLSERPDLLPEPRAVAQAFGRGSLTFARARLVLETLWAELHDDPEIRLKRELWDGLLREAYGEEVGGDSLFLQHSYLAFVVKAIAARVLDLPVDDPAALLSGRALADEGILGAVELGDLVLDRPARLTVPVFLGDGMQWNLRRYLDRADVLVDVPGEQPLQIPTDFAEDQAVFEQALDALNQGLHDDSAPATVGQRLRQIAGAAPAAADALAATFAHLQALYRAGRNGIWTFVFRNLVRPVWLSRPEQRADVLVGNPPWIVYRHLSPAMKERLRDGLTEYGLWVGGNLATQQDMCALFWARGAERYLAPGGRIGFVLPYAVLNAPVFAALRAGRLNRVQVGITGAWALERVWPIFGAQSGSSTTSTCVLFGRRDDANDPPAEIDRWVGHLTHRDANEAEAVRVLSRSQAPWPRPRTLIGASVYRARFRDGATIYPRRFFIVDPEPTGRLGGRRDAPRMHGRAGALDKRPWSSVEPPRGPVERQFLRQLALGETVAPFRLLDTVTAVTPLDRATLLDADAARDAGYRHLAAWLGDAEAKWAEHCNKGADGQPRMTLRQQIDHMRKLSVQAGPPAIRVLYTKAGTRLSAATILGGGTLVDHKAHWATARSKEEAAFLLAVLNSAAVLGKISDLQSYGQRDKRDFDNLVWT